MRINQNASKTQVTAQKLVGDGKPVAAPARQTDQVIEDGDAELVARLRQRDGVAYFQLHGQYRDRVYGLALKLLGDQHLAEDVMQEVFLQVFRKLHLFRGDAKLSTWIFRITVNACRSRQRSIERERRVDPHEVVARTQLRGVVDPDHEIGRGEMRSQIEEALSALTAEQREILLLKTVDELSYDEIGAAVDLSRPRVRGKLYRARKAFREAYERAGTDASAGLPIVETDEAEIDLTAEAPKKARQSRTAKTSKARTTKAKTKTPAADAAERAQPVTPILRIMAEAG